jgi:hypothetical protein
MTRRRAVAVAGAVLRRLRGGYGCAAVEAPWVPTRPTRPPPPCHAPWTARGVASTPSALSSSALAATAPDPAPAAEEERGGSPIAETGAETCSARFARWTRNRARALRVSPSARWRLSAEEQAEDVAVARAILHEARAAGLYDPSRRAHPRDAAADVARAFIALTTLASHPDAGWRCETEEDARAVAALFRDVRFLIPRHLERDVDLVRCVDAFRHAGVWDIARDAERALRERVDLGGKGGKGEEAYRDDDPENHSTDPSIVLEALGADGGAAFALMRSARGLGGSSRAHNWGTGGGDSAARLYDAETWRGSKGRETRETTRSPRGVHKNETGADGRDTYRARFGDVVSKNAPPPEERLRRATMWTKTLSEFVKSESMTPSHAGSSRSSHVVPTDDAATEMLFQNLAVWADVSTRALHGDRAAYLVARRAGSDKLKARRRRRKGRGEAGEGDVSNVREEDAALFVRDGEDEETEETTDAFEDDFEDDEHAELERPRSLAARRRAHYRGLRHALRHMRALAEAHARDPDANARAMPPPLEIALVVNAFLRARAPASGASGSAVGYKGADADDARAANRHMADFEACADALTLWRLALDASGSEEGAYREKFFPHQVWARDEHHEREVFNPAAEKFRKQMRELVDAAGENARENVRLTLSGRKKTNGDGTEDASAAALRASTSALRALTILAQRGIPTRRLAFDRVAAAALDAAERMCTAGGSEVEVADAAATALRAYQIASEREHEGRIRDAPVRRWCRVAEKAVVALQSVLEQNAGHVRPETLGVLVAAAGAFAGRETLAGDVGALLAAADDAVAAEKMLPGSFAASASAHDAQRVLVGWRRFKEADAEALHANRIRYAPTPAALLAVLQAAARALRDELDPQTVHDIVFGADAVEREVLAAEADADADLAARLAAARSALAEAKKEARARREARDAAHVAASRLCLQGLRAMDEPAPPPDLAREAARASEATAAAAADLEGAMIAKCARAWARLVRGARVFPDPAAVAATLAALPEARPPASTADLRMIERAVLDVETARASAEPHPFPSTGKNPPTSTADREGLFQTKTKEETLDAYVRRWLDASPAKARAALEASLATADAGAGGSKAGALVAAARADTTKVRAKLREAILAAFEGETGW